MHRYSKTSLSRQARGEGLAELAGIPTYAQTLYVGKNFSTPALCRVARVLSMSAKTSVYRHHARLLTQVTNRCKHLYSTYYFFQKFVCMYIRNWL